MIDDCSILKRISSCLSAVWVLCIKQRTIKLTNRLPSLKHDNSHELSSYRGTKIMIMTVLWAGYVFFFIHNHFGQYVSMIVNYCFSTPFFEWIESYLLSMLSSCSLINNSTWSYFFVSASLAIFFCRRFVSLSRAVHTWQFSKCVNTFDLTHHYGSSQQLWIIPRLFPRTRTCLAGCS